MWSCRGFHPAFVSSAQLLQEEGGGIVAPGAVHFVVLEHAASNEAVGAEPALPGGEGQRHSLLGLFKPSPHCHEVLIGVLHRAELIEQVGHGVVFTIGLVEGEGEGVLVDVLQNRGGLETLTRARRAYHLYGDRDRVHAVHGHRRGLHRGRLHWRR